jgi:hypothetical protein
MEMVSDSARKLGVVAAASWMLQLGPFELAFRRRFSLDSWVLGGMDRSGSSV